MQITDPAPTADQVWNWHDNVDGGNALYLDKHSAALNFPAQVQGCQGFKGAVELLKAHLGQPNLNVLVPAYTSDQLERDTIRAWNGFGKHSQFGLWQHEYELAYENGYLKIGEINNGQAYAVWVEVPESQRRQDKGDPAFVRHVMSKTPECTG